MFTLPRHESAIKEKTWKSSHSELHKREALTQRSWGSGGKFHVFSSKNALDWLILSQFLPLIL